MKIFHQQPGWAEANIPFMCIFCFQVGWFRFILLFCVSKRWKKSLLRVTPAWPLHMYVHVATRYFNHFCFPTVFRMVFVIVRRISVLTVYFPIPYILNHLHSAHRSLLVEYLSSDIHQHHRRSETNAVKQRIRVATRNAVFCCCFSTRIIKRRALVLVRKNIPEYHLTCKNSSIFAKLAKIRHKSSMSLTWGGTSQ